MAQGVLWTFRRDPPVESDEQLTEQARAGDRAAFGELYRRHRKAAESTAWCLLRSKSEADDVVSDAFAGVLAAFRNGRGPRDNFRRYLLACVRNGCRIRRPAVLPLHDDGLSPDRTGPTFEDPERYVEADIVARAFASLAPRWQHTLWLTEVEQWPASDVSQHFQLSPNATAALTHRARQAFATAYLAEHVADVPSKQCARFTAQLAGYVRDQLPAGQHASVEQHVATCAACAKAVADLRDMNASLRSLAPAPGAIAGVGIASQLAGAGTSIVTTSLGGASAGIFGGGLLLKGAAALLVVAPVMVADATARGRDGRRDPTMEVEAAAADIATAPAALSPSGVAARSPTTVVTQPPATSVVVDVADAPEAFTDRSSNDPAAAGDWTDVVAVPAPPSTTPALPPVTLPTPTVTVPDLVEPGALQPITSRVDGLVGDVAGPVVDDVGESAVALVDQVLVDAGLPGVDDLVSLFYGFVPSVGLPVFDTALELTPLDPDPEQDATISSLLDSVDETATVSEITVTAQPGPPTRGGSQAAADGEDSAPAPSASTPQSAQAPAAPAATAPPTTSVPGIVVPPISVPPVSVPVLDIPAVTVPVISIAPISVPQVTLPDIE